MTVAAEPSSLTAPFMKAVMTLNSPTDVYLELAFPTATFVLKRTSLLVSVVAEPADAKMVSVEHNAPPSLAVPMISPSTALTASVLSPWPIASEMHLVLSRDLTDVLTTSASRISLIARDPNEATNPKSFN